MGSVVKSKVKPKVKHEVRQGQSTIEILTIKPDFTSTCAMSVSLNQGIIQMKTKLTQGFLATFVAISTLVATGNSAEAAGFNSCSGTGYNISGNVLGAQNCTVSTDANQDFLNTAPMTVNANTGFFDKTNWTFGGKIDVDTGYLGSGSGQSGTFNLSSVYASEWDKIMLVFKDGAGTYLTGYLLSDGVTSGTWTTPFQTSANGSIYNFKGKTKDVSHISVYYTISTSTSQMPSAVKTAAAPEGAQMAGLVLAIGAAGYLKRKFQ